MTPKDRKNKRLVGLFLLGCVLFNYPLLSLFNLKTMIFGVPLLFFYVFTGWTLLILLAAIAQYYRHMDYNTQATHRDEPPHRYPGAILDRVWETTSVIVPCAKAYDAIYPALGDPQAAEFLRGQGIEDARRHIEDNLLWVTFSVTTCQTVELRITGAYGPSPAIRELGLYHELSQQAN